MRRKAVTLSAIGLTLALTACAEKPPQAIAQQDEIFPSEPILVEPWPPTEVITAIPALNTTNATCTGHFYFDSSNAGRGRSECRGGGGVDFSAITATAVNGIVACNYTLVYDMAAEPQHGTGDVACNDRSTGKIIFRQTGPHEGEIAVDLKDGRHIDLTYMRND